MCRLVLVLSVLLPLLLVPQPVRAQPVCQFTLGFAVLHEVIPEIVGDCLENEHPDGVTGDALQATTGGLLVWRKADNWTAFTDGGRSWVNGPCGLEERANEERFAWERDPAASCVATVAPPTGRAAAVAQLLVAEVPADIPAYSRAAWRHWVDADGDCQDTRAEVLIEESLITVVFVDARQCRVVAGRWIDPYTGRELAEASTLDIDHLVPLANAHRSGGWAWSPMERERFANELGDPAHLIAVTASATGSRRLPPHRGPRRPGNPSGR